MHVSGSNLRIWLISIIPLSLFGCGHTNEKVHAVMPTYANHGSVVNKNDVPVIKLSSETAEAMELCLAEVKQRLLNSVVRTTGEVLANANLLTHVNSPVSGRVGEVMVSVGDWVSKGQPLLVIRSGDIEQAEADLLQNEAQVKAELKRDLLQIDFEISQAQAQIKLSESTYNRVKSLLEEKIASRAEFESARTQYEKDKNTLDALKRKRQATMSLSTERKQLLTEPIKQKLKIVGLAESDIAKVMRNQAVDPVVSLVAPENGIVSERMINVGELADPSKVLLIIGDFHSVWLKADIYEKDIAKVKVGQPIELTVDSLQGEKFVGRLNYVADSVNPDSRTLSVRAEVANPGLKLKPRMFARMSILVGKNNILSIPKDAVQDAGSYKVVYVPLGKGRFAERKISLGLESGGFVEVLSGLGSGEKVVTKGSFELRALALKTVD